MSISAPGGGTGAAPGSACAAKAPAPPGSRRRAPSGSSGSPTSPQRAPRPASEGAGVTRWVSTPCGVSIRASSQPSVTSGPSAAASAASSAGSEGSAKRMSRATAEAPAPRSASIRRACRLRGQGQMPISARLELSISTTRVEPLTDREAAVKRQSSRRRSSEASMPDWVNPNSTRIATMAAVHLSRCRK